MNSSNDAIVADAGPLIALARIDALNLLSVLGAPVLVPEAVEAECLRRPWRAGARQIDAALGDGTLSRLPRPDAASVFAAIPSLGDGETQAIEAAVALGAVLLIDERRGRAVAAARGVDVLGTLGVLVLARRRGLLDALTPSLHRLDSVGYHLSARLIDKALKAVGER